MTWNGSGIAGDVQVHYAIFCSDVYQRLEMQKCVTIQQVMPILGIPDALVSIASFNSKVVSLWVSVYPHPSQPPRIYTGKRH
ncbi:hypothetical protein KP509_29G034000 [Ceratopteris richardii]|uniref:Uncharacterized protein n=2 Tax=Ceratopteris richardii TaxID=49495 RepID=A0A8T2R5Z4_CERRI|nr:hypothetical protein KP509_29G034000 [Ceratopteris richardii]